MDRHGINRREFLKTAAATGAVASLGGCVSLGGLGRGGRLIAPDQKLNIACIGVGGKGWTDVNGVATENLVGFCDVDDERAAQTYNKFPDVPRFRDYREMLTELDDKIDAVTVTTPDHTHYAASMMAMEMGKHVYVQKPLSRTIAECREMKAAARKYGVISQMGNQGHANEGTRLVKEWIEAGVIGPVHEVHIWTKRPLTTGQYKWVQGIERPTDRMKTPETLDWNLWLGTAPRRPYHSAYAPFRWRAWWDFGCGALGDMGCHIMDASFWALSLGMPESVETESSPVNNETAPEWSVVTYRFPARGEMPPVKLVWYDGEVLPPRPKDLEKDRELATDGQLIFGEKGTIMADTYCASPRIIPEEKMREAQPKLPPKTIARVPKNDPYQEWINACKGGPTPGSSFEYSAELTEMVLLGNLALRSGRKIEWSPKKMMVTNVAAANQYVDEPRRSGFKGAGVEPTLLEFKEPTRPTRNRRPRSTQRASRNT